MEIKEGQFYKMKDEVKGMKTPGGYAYVVEINGDKVKIGIAEQPEKSALTGGAFTLPLSDLETLIEI